MKIDPDEIIAAVGSDFAPPSLSKTALAEDVGGIQIAYGIYERYSSQAESRRVRENIGNIRKRAKSLLVEMGADEDAEWRRRLQWPIPTNANEIALGQLVKGLRQLVDLAGKADAEMPEDSAIPMLLQMERSPVEKLVREDIAPVYKDHFQREPGISRSKDGSGGPFTRFALAALKALKIQQPNGKPYAAETIARAMSSGAPRRKKVVQTPPKI